MQITCPVYEKLSDKFVIGEPDCQTGGNNSQSSKSTKSYLVNADGTTNCKAILLSVLRILYEKIRVKKRG